MEEVKHHFLHLVSLVSSVLVSSWPAITRPPKQSTDVVINNLEVHIYSTSPAAEHLT